MKTELNRLIKNGVRKELQYRVRDRVYTYENQGTLYVQIVDRSTFTVIYQDEVQDFITRIASGLTCKELAINICQNYKNQILSKYFVDFRCKNHNSMI